MGWRGGEVEDACYGDDGCGRGVGAGLVLVGWVQGWIGVKACFDGRELGEGQGEVGACVDAGEGYAHAVDGEGVVVEDGVVERFGVEQGGREGCPRGFGVVEGDDEDGVGVGEGAVPEVVIGRRANRKGAAVDGQQGWEERGRRQIMMRREENAIVPSVG